MRHVLGPVVGLCVLLVGLSDAFAETAAMTRQTTVSLSGQEFRINGRPTYEGRSWNGMKIEGLLMNSRMVQGIFDDRNPETRAKWNYPDGAWDPARNTREFVAAMPEWRRHGLLAFTINFQGGSPQGYSSQQPWHNSAFEADGTLRTDYLARLRAVLDKADELGMVAIVGFFYFGQDERLADEKAVIKAVENATDWLLLKEYTNVLVEIDNEANVDKYDHAILKPGRVHELIDRVKKRSEGKVKSPAGRLLVGTSMGGGAIPPENIVAASDFLLIHGNGVSEPDRIRKMVDQCRAVKTFRGQPIVFNEDDHFNFDKPDNNMIAAVSKHASWGYFDYRMKGEGFDEGYQSVPTNWGFSSERKRGFFGLLAKMTGAAEEKGPKGDAGAAAAPAPAAKEPVSIDTPAVRLTLSPDTGAYEIQDKAGGVTWKSSLLKPRFGQAMIKVEGKPTGFAMGPCEAKVEGGTLVATFRPMPGKPDAWLRVKAAPAAGGKALDFSYEAAPGVEVESLRLLDESLWVTDADKGYIAVPCREGLLIPADSGKAFSRGFDTSGYEGCHMQMVGVVKGGAAALVTWDDLYTVAEVKSATAGVEAAKAKQVVSLSMILKKSGRGCRVTFLGRGDYNTIARAYRDVAKQRGLVVTWDEKLKGHPDRARYFGAINFKLWSTLSRKMNEDSTKEESVTVNWTFDEAAQVAEHLKNDLKLDRVLFTMGGWIRRGYDNQHPDILPTAPECGGDAKFTEACQRIRAQGYILSLHDNYQDMYRDAPSWDESYIMRHPDGSLVKGGHWAGGICYLTCSERAVDLAKRPQNLPAVKKLSDADSYFIDTTYAAGFCECFDPKHPLKRADDMKWKQAISDYAREVFGSFGSECGREWAIPHADFFEGLTGVSGTYYHDKNLLASVGGVPVPLFEMVYRDCIAMYGKYGYDIYRSSEYVLDHISIGRPLNYHSIPQHLYWQGWKGKAQPAQVAPQAAEVKVTGKRTLEITYHWLVEKPLDRDWLVLVHFTPRDGADIKFQNDHMPPTSKWAVGDVADGPYKVTIPENQQGEFDVRVGFFSKPTLGRVTLLGEADGECRYTVGRLKVTPEGATFTPVTPRRIQSAGAPDLFVQADGGWAEGMHPVDIYVKNTYEILSPLNEITSRVRLTQHEFLTPDRKVRRTVFGEGADAVEVVVNLGEAPVMRTSKLGGEVVLPAYGFLVEGPTFVAFCATKWGGMAYAGPTLFTLRSLDGEPLTQSGKVRIYHGFGDSKVKFTGAVRTVTKEDTISAK